MKTIIRAYTFGAAGAAGAASFGLAALAFLAVLGRRALRRELAEATATLQRVVSTDAPGPWTYSACFHRPQVMSYPTPCQECE